MPIKVAELFAGVGGFRLGLDGYRDAGGTGLDAPGAGGFETVWANQWEPDGRASKQFAWRCYEERFGEGSCVNEDITKVMDEVEAGERELPDVDMVVGGFPCQAFSIARPLSRATGLSGDKGTKGVLWFEIYRFLQQKHPRWCLFENVDRLLKSPASCRGRDFATILCCLAVEGYAVEWRVVNSAEYGFPQRRKRTFIYAERLGDGAPSTDEERLAMMNSGVMADALPHSPVTADAVTAIDLRHDPYEENHGFVPGRGGRSPFGGCGVMSGFRVLTCDVEAAYDGEQAVLGDVLSDEGDVPEAYVVDGADLDRWRWLKGSKRERRVTKDGHEWWYSEGAMAFPDLATNPSRTILTSEGGRSASRMKHIIEVDGRWRRLVPEELERLQGFPAGWTDGCGMTDNQRAFCMGNALVVGVVRRIGEAIARHAAASPEGGESVDAG